VVCCGLLWQAESGRACGPFDIESVLVGPVALRSPVVDFPTEFAAIPDPPTVAEDFATGLSLPVAGDSGPRAPTAESSISEIDLAQFRSAIEQRVSADNLRLALQEYSRTRDILRKALPRNFEWTAAPDARLRATISEISIPESWPAEFRNYVAGVRWFCLGDPMRAVKEWETILALPGPERAKRGLWAAYMIGRVLTAGDPPRAVGFLRKVRVIAAAGAEDPQRLAAESYGWEARAEWKRGNYERAAALYTLYSRAGAVRALPNQYGGRWKPADMALVSLRTVIKDLFAKADDDRLLVAAQDSWFRRVVTLHVLPQRFQSPHVAGGINAAARPAMRWIGMLAKAHIEVGQDEALRIAWAAYAAGDYEEARQWIKRAPSPSPDRNWLAGKIALQDGRIEEARRLFVAAAGTNRTTDVKLSPHIDIDSGAVEDPAMFRREQLAVDAGISHMAMARFVGALDWLLSSGYWRDAAYVAERLMSAEELLGYVRSRPDSKGVGQTDTAEFGRQLREWIEGERWDKARESVHSWWDSSPHQSDGASRLRYLLARRLARERFFKDALLWYPPELRPAFDAYVQSFRRGHDARLSDECRAGHLWCAAQIHRHLGMELFGAELTPDNFRQEGMFPDTLPERHRRCSPDGLLRTQRPREEIASWQTWATVPRVHPDESWCHRHYGVSPAKRFHYRYVASDLAWEAGGLLSDDTVELARVLNEAGSWLKYRDPKAADRFYKSLVLRNKNTLIGHAADRKRWFLTSEQIDSLAR